MRALILLAMVAACAPKSGPATSSPYGEVADGKHLTEFQASRLLGHYSTEDGMSGFVLDRTVDPPRARLDGDPTVRTLAKQGSVSDAYELVSEDGAIWLRIHEPSGEVMLFDGPRQTQGVDVLRDADAERLR